MALYVFTFEKRKLGYRSFIVCLVFRQDLEKLNIWKQNIQNAIIGYFSSSNYDLLSKVVFEDILPSRQKAFLFLNSKQKIEKKNIALIEHLRANAIWVATWKSGRVNGLVSV